MKALFVHDNRYIEKEGQIYTEVEFSYESWKFYLQYFDALQIIGRRHIPAEEVLNNIKSLNECSGPNVDFSLYSGLTSLKNILTKYNHVKKAIEQDVANADAVILRGVQENAWLAFVAAKKLGKPVMVEGTGCMWNNTWYYGSLLGKFYAPLRYLRARKVFQEADAVLYVTQKFLQNRYPARGISEAASDVKLSVPDDTILEKRLKYIIGRDNNPLVFGLIGPVHHGHKGVDNALKALAIWHKNTGQDFKFRVLGRGDPKSMHKLANALGIGDKFFHDTARPHNEVIAWLDALDIYIQPSRTEGLPRATLEAMSRALPVIASEAGDLPAVIDPAYIHGRNDIPDLARKIETMTKGRRQLSLQAKRNFEHIQTIFHPDILHEKRDTFWKRFLLMAESMTKEADREIEKG